MIEGLESLRTDAPARALPRVLIETGLADGFTSRPSRLGTVWIAFNGRGVSALVPTDEVDEVASFFDRVNGRPAFPAEMPAELGSRVDQALVTGRSRGVPFDLRHVGRFGRQVLAKTAEIPPGEVRPYGWVAREIGNPGAVRAVGTTLARNPVPVLIPCHRVVRTDGTVGKYAYGPARKMMILEAEGLDIDESTGRIHPRILQ